MTKVKKKILLRELSEVSTHRHVTLILNYGFIIYFLSVGCLLNILFSKWYYVSSLNHHNTIYLKLLPPARSTKWVVVVLVRFWLDEFLHSSFCNHINLYLFLLFTSVRHYYLLLARNWNNANSVGRKQKIAE